MDQRGGAAAPPREEVAARRAIGTLLEKLGAEDWDEGVVDLLLGVACSEAGSLLSVASRLRSNSGRSGPGITAADLRVAVEMQQGPPPSAPEARRLRDQCNAQPLPE
ncbi:unnamed protein product, partial [Polarella glacialis]